MADALTIQGMIDANVDVNTIEQVATEDMIVTARNGREFPSGPMASRLILEQGTIDAYLFLTKADLDTGNALGSDTPITLVDNDFGLVFNDETLNNNGYYQMREGELVWLNLNVTRQGLEQIEQAKQAAIAVAATDAQNKANAAQSAAIAAASTNTSDQVALKLDGAVGKNLFNKTKITAGVALNDTGGTFNASARNVSSYIAAKPSTAYSFSNINKAMFYDVNKVFLQSSAGANANVVSPTNTAFVRIDISDSNLSTAQVELGTAKTPYEPYRIVIADNAVSTTAMQDNSVSSIKLKNQSVSAQHFKGATFLNMFDVDTMLLEGVTLSTADGKTLTPIASLDTTDYIPCNSDTQYVTKDAKNVYYYTADKGYISSSATSSSFTTPANCQYVRFTLSATVSSRFQLNQGTVLPSVTPQPYKFSLDKLYIVPKTNIELGDTTARKYSFIDAWIAWRDGQKFPICFLGDSTTNGNGTTGFVHRDDAASLGQDYIAPNAYAKLFQDDIREITGNTQMRAYNAGFSGRNSGWALDNIEEIMGGAYADAKMVGIAHGINDRSADAEAMARLFKSYTEGLIKWLFEHGYQPFMITTQPTTMPLAVGKGSSADIVEIANGIKKELADKYNLELVDVNKYGEQFIQYSQKPLLNNIMEAGGNVIHYGDGGHRFTADLMFASFCKRCIWLDDSARLSYETQLQRSDINFTYISQLATFKEGFKNQVLATHENSSDKLYQEFWVFNITRRQLDLTAYYASAVTGQYVLFNDVQTTITTQGQSLGSLDLGLHKIKAYSSATTALDWLGFKLQ